MKPSALVVLAGLGLAGWLVFRRGGLGGAGQGGSPWSGTVAEERASGQARIGGVTAPLAAAGPLGVAAAVVGGAVDYYNSASPEQQEQARDAGNKIKRTVLKTTIVGQGFLRLAGHKDSIAANRSKRQNLQAQVGVIRDELEGLEAHVGAMHEALARPDVKRWVVDQQGTLNVWYAGRSDPWLLPVPKTSWNPAAWAAELTQRLFGAFVQSSDELDAAPLLMPLERRTGVDAGFSPENPFVTEKWAPANIYEREAGLRQSIGKK